ncbi:hypothetical protein DID77_00745 [Candidatus Marinamargulisbacteria bacterium SCGC AG-439-L15]|nr:hypothetical protein DID77_00745 [Candidatus Marinamargulisbacteria bacterium SCGC AG-439-L15]
MGSVSHKITSLNEIDDWNTLEGSLASEYKTVLRLLLFYQSWETLCNSLKKDMLACLNQRNEMQVQVTDDNISSLIQLDVECQLTNYLDGIVFPTKETTVSHIKELIFSELFPTTSRGLNLLLEPVFFLSMFITGVVLDHDNPFKSLLWTILVLNGVCKSTDYLRHKMNSETELYSVLSMDFMGFVLNQRGWQKGMQHLVLAVKDKSIDMNSKEISRMREAPIKEILKRLSWKNSALLLRSLEEPSETPLDRLTRDTMNPLYKRCLSSSIILWGIVTFSFLCVCIDAGVTAQETKEKEYGLLFGYTMLGMLLTMLIGSDARAATKRSFASVSCRSEHEGRTAGASPTNSQRIYDAWGNPIVERPPSYAQSQRESQV